MRGPVAEDSRPPDAAGRRNVDRLLHKEYAMKHSVIWLLLLGLALCGIGAGCSGDDKGKTPSTQQLQPMNPPPGPGGETGGGAKPGAPKPI